MHLPGPMIPLYIVFTHLLTLAAGMANQSSGRATEQIVVARLYNNLPSCGRRNNVFTLHLGIGQLQSVRPQQMPRREFKHGVEPVVSTLSGLAIVAVLLWQPARVAQCRAQDEIKLAIRTAQLVLSPAT